MQKTQSDKPNSTSTFRQRLKTLASANLDIQALNSMRVWVVMGLLSITLILSGYSAQSRYGLLVGFLVALGLNTLVFFYGDLRLFSLFPNEILEGRDAWGMLRTVRELSARLEVKRPEIHLIESRVPLIFSAGLIPTRTSIFVSSELTRSFSIDELRALFTYELIRLKNQQTASATAASALAGFIALTAGACDEILTLRFLRSSANRQLHRLQIGPMTILTSPLVALIVRLSVSRKDVLNADQQTAAILGDKEIFAHALWKLANYAKTKPYSFNIAEAHLFTVSPLGGHRFWQFASAQPVIETRLNALIGRNSY